MSSWCGLSRDSWRELRPTDHLSYLTFRANNRCNRITFVEIHIVLSFPSSPETMFSAKWSTHFSLSQTRKHTLPMSSVRAFILWKSYFSFCLCFCFYFPWAMYSVFLQTHFWSLENQKLGSHVRHANPSPPPPPPPSLNFCRIIVCYIVQHQLFSFSDWVKFKHVTQ